VTPHFSKVADKQRPTASPDKKNVNSPPFSSQNAQKMTFEITRGVTRNDLKCQCYIKDTLIKPAIKRDTMASSYGVLYYM